MRPIARTSQHENRRNKDIAISVASVVGTWVEIVWQELCAILEIEKVIATVYYILHHVFSLEKKIWPQSTYQVRKLNYFSSSHGKQMKGIQLIDKLQLKNQIKRQLLAACNISRLSWMQLLKCVELYVRTKFTTKFLKNYDSYLEKSPYFRIFTIPEFQICSIRFNW